MEPHESPAASDAAPVHDWMGELFHSFVEELRLYLRTAVDVTLRPKQFVAGWRSGAIRAMNPIAYFGLALAVTVPIETIVFRVFFPARPDLPLWMDVLSPLVPYAGVIVIGLVSNLLFRLAGSRRPIGATVALVLYVQGGPAAALGIVILPTVVLNGRMNAGSDIGIWGPIALLVGNLAVVAHVVLLGRALAALHTVRRRALAFILLIALCAGAAVELPFTPIPLPDLHQQHKPNPAANKVGYRIGVAIRSVGCRMHLTKC